MRGGLVSPSASKNCCTAAIPEAAGLANLRAEQLLQTGSENFNNDHLLKIGKRISEVLKDDDVDGVVALLTDDAWFTMPPANHEYQGPLAIAGFLTQSARYRGNRGTRLIPTRANGQPAFGCYVPDSRARISHLHGILVLTMEGDRICAITRFIDGGLAPHFGLPRTLPT